MVATWNIFWCLVLGVGNCVRLSCLYLPELIDITNGAELNVTCLFSLNLI